MKSLPRARTHTHSLCGRLERSLSSLPCPTRTLTLCECRGSRIPPIFEERLSQLGIWLQSNGDAIYGTRPWSGALPSGSETLPDGSTVYYTSRPAEGKVYCVLLSWPSKGELHLTLPKTTGRTNASLLSTGAALPWTAGTGDGGAVQGTSAGMTIRMGVAPPLNSSLGWVVVLVGI